MVCKNCGKELEQDAIYCKYCGADQREADPEDSPAADSTNSEMNKTDTDKSSADAPRRISRKGIIAIVIVIVAVVVVVIAGVSVSRSNRSTSSGANQSQVISKPKLSSTNVAAAQKVVDCVDKYLEYDSVNSLLYGSESATKDILNAKQSLIAESDSATEEIRQQIIDYIDKIVEELDLNEKTMSNIVGRIIVEGGETTDRDKVESYRNEIEKLIEKYS